MLFLLRHIYALVMTPLARIGAVPGGAGIFRSNREVITTPLAHLGNNVEHVVNNIIYSRVPQHA
jgi:hypothetical protein